MIVTKNNHLIIIGVQEWKTFSMIISLTKEWDKENKAISHTETWFSYYSINIQTFADCS